MKPKKNQEAEILERTSKNKTKKKSNTLFIAITLFLITVLGTGIFSYLRGLATTDIIRNLVMSGMGSLLVLFLMAQAKEFKEYDYDNHEKEVRFFLIYLVELILAISCAYLPAAGWPFLVVFVSLALFSNALIGLAAGTLLLIISMILSGAAISIFVMYFVCGLIGISLFRRLDDSYKIGIPLLVSVLFLLTAETANIVLYANETLKPELFMIPMMNVIISLILLLIILKLFSALVIYRYRDKYMEINDPECELLVEMKEKSKESYYQAVHTAYFCDRIARKLSLDADAVKTGGYYHRIGMLKDNNTYEHVKEIAEQYEFPPVACEILKEFLDKNSSIKKKETAVLLMSDAVVSSMLFLFAREKTGTLDYEQIIDTVFKKKLETDVLASCDISMDEITRMKNIFKEEKLYYDFLR